MKTPCAAENVIFRSKSDMAMQPLALLNNIILLFRFFDTLIIQSLRTNTSYYWF